VLRAHDQHHVTRNGLLGKARTADDRARRRAIKHEASEGDERARLDAVRFC
jgi:hypothetical protein